MVKLKVDFDEVVFAMENASEMVSYFLDKETGDVIVITDDGRWEYDNLLQEVNDSEEGMPDFAEILEESDLQDWQKKEALEIHQVDTEYGTRYIKINPSGSRAGYGDMEDFIPTVREEFLRERLWRAIQGKGAFRYFKDVLLDNLQERQRWFTFKDERSRQRAIEWLASQDIEPILEE